MIKEPQQVLLTLKTGNLQQTDTASNMFPVYQTHYNTTDRTSAFKVKFSMNNKKKNPPPSHLESPGYLLPHYSDTPSGLQLRVTFQCIQ